MVGAEHVRARVELDLAGAVAEVDEGGLAVAAARDHAAGDAVMGVGLLAVGEALVGGAHAVDRLPPREVVRETGRRRARAGGRAWPAARRSVPTRRFGGVCSSDIGLARVFNGRLDAAFAPRSRSGTRRRPTCPGSSRSTTARSSTASRPSTSSRACPGATTPGSPSAIRSTRCSSRTRRRRGRGLGGDRALVAPRRLPAHRRGLGLRGRGAPRRAASACGSCGSWSSGLAAPTSACCWPASRCRTRRACAVHEAAGFRSFGTQRRVRREARPGARRRATRPAPGLGELSEGRWALAVRRGRAVPPRPLRSW